MAVAFVGCVTAAVMLVAFDFAGWEEVEVTSQTRFRYSADPVDIFRTRVRRDVTQQVNYYVSSVTLFGPFFVVIAPVTALLAYGAYVSFRGLRSGVDSLSYSSLRRAFRAALIATVASLAGGVAFELVMLVTDPYEWWEDAGFYGAVSAGATATVLFYLTMRSVRSAA
jgi:uncharacterized membrane protein YjgN (DUF898 family)